MYKCNVKLGIVSFALYMNDINPPLVGCRARIVVDGFQLQVDSPTLT